MNRVDYLLQHPFKTLNDVEQLIVQNLGPDQPDIALIQIHKSQTRRFNARWYKRKPWLTASESRETLFCFNCLLFGGDTAWTCNGVKDLKHLSERVKHHENTARHKENTSKLDSWNKQKDMISVQLSRKEKSSSVSGTAENGGKTAKSVTTDILPMKYETLEDPLLIPSTQTKITPTALENVSLTFSSVNDSASVQHRKVKATVSQSVPLVFNPAAPNSEENGVTVEYFGDELSAGEKPEAELREKRQNKDNVEEVLFHLRAEKLLLELDKLKLERQKMEAERRNIQLRADILSLRKQLVTESVQTESPASAAAPLAAQLVTESVQTESPASAAAPLAAQLVTESVQTESPASAAAPLAAQLVTESVQTESPTSAAAPLAAQDIDIMAASSHQTSQQISHSQNILPVQNSVLPKDLVTNSQTDISSSHCHKALVSDSKCLPQSSEQTVLCQSGNNTDTFPVTSYFSIHHCRKLLSEALQRSASTKSVQAHMSPKNLSCSKDNNGPRENNVTGLHKLVESLPGHVNNELMHNVKLERDQNVGKPHRDSGLTTVQHDADLSIIQGSTGSDFPTHKLGIRSSDNFSVKSTEMSVSLKELGSGKNNVSAMCRSCALNCFNKCMKSSSDKVDKTTDGSDTSHKCADMTSGTLDIQDLSSSLSRQAGLGRREMDSSTGSSCKHENMDGSLRSLKDSMVPVTSTGGTSHKLKESVHTVDNLSSWNMLHSSQHRRKQSWKQCLQKHQSTAEETFRNDHSSFASRRNCSDYQKSEFSVRCANTVQLEQESYNGSKEMVYKSFHASKHGERDMSGTNDKDDNATVCKRIKTEDVQS